MLDVPTLDVPTLDVLSRHLELEVDMGRRYVPKTYNNRRLLRIIFVSAISVALSALILFLLLFFVLENYYVDGRLEIPWLTEDAQLSE